MKAPCPAPAVRSATSSLPGYPWLRIDKRALAVHVRNGGEPPVPAEQVDEIFAEIPDVLTRATSLDLAKIGGTAKRLYVERYLASSHSPAGTKRK